MDIGDGGGDSAAVLIPSSLMNKGCLDLEEEDTDTGLSGDLGSPRREVGGGAEPPDHNNHHEGSEIGLADIGMGAGTPGESSEESSYVEELPQIESPVECGGKIMSSHGVVESKPLLEAQKHHHHLSSAVPVPPIIQNEKKSVGGGFQKENRFVKLLPYHEELEHETEEILQNILSNLGEAVLRKDFQVGLKFHSNDLSLYVDMYGLKFSREQHVALIKLYLELLTMETFPPNCIATAAGMLNFLLRKANLLSRDDIIIPWKSLYKTYYRWVLCVKHPISCNTLSYIKTTLKDTIAVANVFFEEGAAQQIIAEFRPLLCPTSSKMQMALTMLYDFLPFRDPGAETQINKLMEELLGYFLAWNNHPDWEWTIVSLFGKAVFHMPDSLDWIPHLPVFYARLLKNLELPVDFKELQNAKSNSCNTSGAVYLIVHSLGNNPTALGYLKNFLKCVETYYGPSNCGEWSGSLGSFMREMVNEFCHRVKGERYRDYSKRWWYRSHSPARQLTDSDIDEFVKIVLSVILDFYLNSGMIGVVIKELSELRPQLVIPAVMEKYWDTVENLTEPEKYITVLQWVTSICHPMIRGREGEGKESYDGRELVIPFAMSLLPGLDSNDMSKTLQVLISLQFLFMNIPVVDCSSLANKVEDKKEKELCLATAYLEDFLLQFIDRVLSLIENCTLENTRADSHANSSASNAWNNETYTLDAVFMTVFHHLVSQTSREICQSVVSKLADYALTTTLETEVAGRLFTGMMQVIAGARGEVVLPRLVPQLCARVEAFMEDADKAVLDDEEGDKELLFSLQLLSSITETNGRELLPYRAQLESALFAALKLNGKKAYGFTSKMIANLLQSLILVYPLECKLSEEDFDDPNYLAIHDWGKTVDPKGDNNEVHIQWHNPSQDELEWAKALFLKIFLEYSGKLEGIGEATEGDKELSKRLFKYVRVLYAAYGGINTLLPFWDQCPSLCDDTVMEHLPGDFSPAGFPSMEIKVPGTEEEITQAYYRLCCGVESYLDKFRPDDVEAYGALIMGLYSLVIPHVEADRRGIPEVVMKDPTLPAVTLNPKKKWHRAYLIRKVNDVHLKRMRVFFRNPKWTAGHLEVLRSLFKLCTNQYAVIRAQAQQAFFTATNRFVGLLPRFLKDLFVDKLKEGGGSHDEYKGTLYTIIGGAFSPLIQNRWEDICQLWSALVKGPFLSDKKSISQVMEAIEALITKNFDYFPLEQTIPPNSNLSKCVEELIPGVELNETSVKETGTSPETFYLNLVKELIEIGSDGEGHWLRQYMAMSLLDTAVMVDKKVVPVTEELVKLYFDTLVSSHVKMRSGACGSVAWLMEAFKRHCPSVILNTEKNLELEPGESIHSILQYTSKKPDNNLERRKYKLTDLPSGPEVLYIHRNHLGFTELPEKLKIFLSVNESSFSDHQDQTEACKVVLSWSQKCFQDEDYVKKLMSFWSLELTGETKWRYSIIQSVTRNCGPASLKLVLEHAHLFVKEKDQWKQRCAADIVRGIIAGMKLWGDEVIEKFWREEFKSVLEDCLNNINQETLEYWCGSINYAMVGRDPNKYRFLIEFLKERFIQSLAIADSTSVDAFKDIIIFSDVIVEGRWRFGALLQETLTLLMKHLSDNPNPYKKVRLEIGGLLSVCLKWDVSSSPIKFGCDFSPKYEPFVRFLLSQLENLEGEAVKYQAELKGSPENDQIRKLLLRFKITLEWIWDTCQVDTSVPLCLYQFIPLLCQFEGYDQDPEVAELAGCALSCLAKSVITPGHLPTILGILDKASECASWKARANLLEFIKVLGFHNVTILASRKEWSEQVIQLVLKLLEDRKLEVREAAATILCGFFHCQLVKEPMDLLAKFKTSAAAFAMNRRQRVPIPPESVDSAHSSILALCAYVDAHPYHVPKELPDVLVILASHLNDPLPIPATIRKCLMNFRTTHQEDWPAHKKMFSEDQLGIFTDVFVSPYYYA